MKKKMKLYHNCDMFPQDKVRLVLFDKTTNHAQYSTTVDGISKTISFPVYKTCCHFAKDPKFTKKVDLSKRYPILILKLR